MTGKYMKYLELTRGKRAIVDDDDYALLSQWKWSAVKGNGKLSNFYAMRGEKRKTIKLHRFIMKAKKGEIIDHLDGNGLNNTKKNLRRCSQQENIRNSRKRRGTSSRYKGVSWDKREKKWSAYITFDYAKIALGNHDSENEAAIQYNEKAKELFGEFAKLNIISKP